MVQDGDAARSARIVGVVGDVKHYGLDSRGHAGRLRADPAGAGRDRAMADQQYVLGHANGRRSRRRSRDAFRRALRAVDPDVPASAMRTMDEALELALAPRRMNLWLVRVFALARARARRRRASMP